MPLFAPSCNGAIRFRDFKLSHYPATTALAFCKRAMLIWRRVAESCVDLHPRRVGRVSVPRQRAAPDSPDGGQFRRLAWMQIIELPRRRRTEAQPVFDLQPEGLSYDD